MIIYLGGPIDQRTSDESWKIIVGEWLASNGFDAVDPESYGYALLAEGAGQQTVWKNTLWLREQCDYAIYHWGWQSVGTHVKVAKDRDLGRDFIVWDLAPEERLQRVALWGVQCALTLPTAIQKYAIPFLARGDESLRERLAETWDTISMSQKVRLLVPDNTSISRQK